MSDKDLRERLARALYDTREDKSEDPRRGFYVEEWGDQIDALNAVYAAAGYAVVRKEDLAPFTNFAVQNTDDDGWTRGVHREAISTWFGPSEFRALLAASKEEG